MARTLAEKVWDAHVVRRAEGEPDLLYIDLHLVHEVTSPQAFDGLRLAGRPVRRPDLTLATEDHNVPTTDIDQPIADPVSRTQVETLRAQLRRVRRPAAPARRRRAGHRARRRPAARPDPAGHDRRLRRLATPPRTARSARSPSASAPARSSTCSPPRRCRCSPFQTMAVTVEGELPPGVTAKDLILAVIAQIGTGGGQGHVIEYRGEAIRALSMEARMTVCNMSIEAGARAGHDRPRRDDVRLPARPARTRRRATTGTPPSPTGGRCVTDDDAAFDREVVIDATQLAPFVTWGTNPGAGRAAVAPSSPTRRVSPTRTSAPPPSGPWSTWA